jgi:hypothetical protein
VGLVIPVTPEQRLDRLERIARLMVRAGLRARQNAREQDAKIDIMINAQIKYEEQAAVQRQAWHERAKILDEKVKFLLDMQRRNDERFAKNDEIRAKHDERFAKYDERFAKYDELFAKHDELFARNDERFAKNDSRLDALIDILRMERNGGSTTNRK